MVLSRGDENEVIEFKKGSVARVEMTGKKSGTLHWCITPKIASAAYEAASPQPSRNGTNGSRPHGHARKRAKTASQARAKIS
jgi:hypothetical protein